MPTKGKAGELLEAEFDTSDSSHGLISGPEEENHVHITTPATPRTPRSSNPKTIRCPYEDCPKTFNRQARLTEHIRSHTNTRPFSCPHNRCEKHFLRDSHLKHHIKSAHSSVRDYPCTWDGCSKSFATGTRLRRHEAAHQGREKWRCRGYQGCTETFRKHDTLRRHIITVHEQKKPFSCTDMGDSTGQVCTGTFDTAEKLRAHQRAKHDNSRFACTECLQRQAEMQDNTFSDLINVNVDPLEVQGCQAYFATYADFQLHIALVHPPCCTYCPVNFTTSRELTRHLELVHVIADPGSPESDTKSAFPCTHARCDRSFSKKGNLNVHIKTVHERRRDFICGQSELALTQLQDAEDQRQELIGCGRDFTSKSSLEEHVRTAHLGLGSKRIEREKKRRLEKENLESSDPSLQKRKKSRKGQGKKYTALATLTGVPERNDTRQPTFSEEGFRGGAIFDERQWIAGNDSEVYAFEAAAAYREAYERTGALWPDMGDSLNRDDQSTTYLDEGNTAPTAVLDPLLLLA